VYSGEYRFSKYITRPTYSKAFVRGWCYTRHVRQRLPLSLHLNRATHWAAGSVRRRAGNSPAGGSFGFVYGRRDASGGADRRRRTVSAQLELAEQSLVLTKVGGVTRRIAARLGAPVRLAVGAMLCGLVRLQIGLPQRAVAARRTRKSTLLVGDHVTLQMHFAHNKAP